MKYDKTFFDYVDSGAIRSAEAITSHLFPLLQPSSVLDVGCGRGGWLQAWSHAGCKAVQGVDGDYVDLNTLHFSKMDFIVKDLTKQFDLGRRYDLVQCLEVAEHIHADASESLVDSIVRHGDIVLFSAAQLGQGGTQHINERPLSYWRDVFQARGFQAHDYIRHLFHANDRIEPWYRFNSVLYANPAGQSRLPDVIRATAMSESAEFPEFAPFLWRFRCAVFQHVPVSIVDKVAFLNAKMRRFRS